MPNIKEYKILVMEYEEKIRIAKRKNDFDVLSFYKSKLKKLKEKRL
jgi:hypothetical protein